jgi:hypothetical protein
MKMLNSFDVNSIPCSYRNETNGVQIIRISEPISAYFERAVMPGQIVYFKAPMHSALEIHTTKMASSVHADTLPCEQLHCPSNNVINGGNDLLKKQDISIKSHSLSKAA